MHLDLARHVNTGRGGTCGLVLLQIDFGSSNFLKFVITAVGCAYVYSCYCVTVAFRLDPDRYSCTPQLAYELTGTETGASLADSFTEGLSSSRRESQSGYLVVRLHIYLS